MLKRRFMHPLVAVVVLVSMLLQGTWVLAGTTGSLTGTVTDTKTGTAIAQAKVTATSPSQTVTTTTDNGGHFTFASLAPDTYTVSAEKQGYDPLTQSGVNIFADASQTLSLSIHVPLQTVARVFSRSNSDLVKPGTTADVYSINSTQQDKFSGVGGGGGLNNAYSAIATVPGAYVPNNQAGYFQTISIRGGDYDQVGYEVDGIPVNRSFDNYPAGTASSLGQQELQVYTGAAPANAEGQGLSGFINQVIRTGTYPGFANVDLGLGGPTYYHKASIEFGGASPNRNFSYYVGLGGYNQDFRYVDQGNGQSLQAYGQQLGVNGNGVVVPNGTVALGIGGDGIQTVPIDLGQVSNLVDRDTVANVHFGIPHHHDGSKDDIQLLYVNNFLRSYFFSSPNDVGNANYAAVGAGEPTEFDAYSYTGKVGAPLVANPSAAIVPYYFPNTSNSRAFDAQIDPNNRDTYQNDQALFKIQYQKNFSSNAYFRLYGYTGYSDWLQNGQDFTYNTYTAGVVDAVSPDYNLFSHTRGISGTFADQINSQNLLQLQGSFTTASVVRDNNTQVLQAASSARNRFATVVSAANPTNGICYNTSSGAAVAANCDYTSGAAVRSTYLTLSGLASGAAPASLNGLSCGGSACEYYAVENGQYATFNSVTPNFIGSSLTDTFKPTDKLTLNAGLRFDDFQYDGSSTTGTAARSLFFSAFNLNHCVDQGVVSTLGAPVTNADGTPGTHAQVNAACAAAGLGQGTVLQNASAQVETYPVFQPRAGLTYSLNSDTVLRASYGRYAQAPNTAYEQYNYLQQNSPAQLGTAFYKYGFTTPGHTVSPEVSNNYDFSLEHHFKGSDVSFKLTPFYRYTQNQIQNFFLDQASGFVSGLNADRLTSRGVEFQLNKGDFGRDGFAGQLSFTYTNAYANYNSFANNANVFSGINTDIKTYNAYTSACATGKAKASICGKTSNGGTATACYLADGTPDATCTAGTATNADIANPYWNAPAQSLVDPNGNYTPFSLITGPIGASANGYIVPYVTQLILNYKKGPFAFTPSFGFTAGQRYGVPESSPGIDPASGCAALGATTGDPRYPYGAPGGSSYDATTCAANLNAIPDPFTKKFDGIGDFVNPSNITANLQLSYQASKNLTFTANFANIINNCFGGSKEAWTTGGSNVCSYGLVDAGDLYQFVGNSYNPKGSANPTVISPSVASPYERSYGVFNTDGSSTKLPFNVFVDAKIKI